MQKLPKLKSITSSHSKRMEDSDKAARQIDREGVPQIIPTQKYLHFHSAVNWAA
jgi:hypothetical protein